MATYSTYEAKARFGEIIRRVRAGQRAVITYRGEEVAEIRPIKAAEKSLEESLPRLEEDGILGPPGQAPGRLQPLARRRGALTRFLESRE
jgi:prevent-host-death family protein